MSILHRDGLPVQPEPATLWPGWTDELRYTLAEADSFTPFDDHDQAAWNEATRDHDETPGPDLSDAAWLRDQAAVIRPFRGR